MRYFVPLTLTRLDVQWRKRAEKAVDQSEHLHFGRIAKLRDELMERLDAFARVSASDVLALEKLIEVDKRNDRLAKMTMSAWKE